MKKYSTSLSKNQNSPPTHTHTKEWNIGHDVLFTSQYPLLTRCQCGSKHQRQDYGYNQQNSSYNGGDTVSAMVQIASWKEIRHTSHEEVSFGDTKFEVSMG